MCVSAYGSDWVGNPQVTLVTMITFITIFAMIAVVTLVTMVTWGIPSHSDNSDVSGDIRKGQRSIAGERAKIVTPRIHFLTCLVCLCFVYSH